MKNSEIYRRTLKFSLMRILCSLIGIICLIGIPALAMFFTMSPENSTQLIVAGVTIVIGIVIFALIARYAGYLFRAGQIAMITEGVATDSLPEDVYAAGKQKVRQRFGTASVYFLITGIISGITSQITNGLNALGKVADGGNNGPASGIAGAISIVIAVVLEYLNYCCLGWVFLHNDQNAFKSTCDGAVVYFQNWKTLLKNAGKIIGITLLSLVVIGGPLCLLSYAIMQSFPAFVTAMSEIDTLIVFDDGTAVPAGTALIIAAAIAGLLVWSGIHGAFVSPYILISVLRRYLEAGIANPPRIDVYGKLAGMSKSFRKALGRAEKDGAIAPGSVVS